jgi:hypothetical protein
MQSTTKKEKENRRKKDTVYFAQGGYQRSGSDAFMGEK